MTTFSCLGFLFFMHCQMPEPVQPTVVVCPPVVDWAASDQQAAAAELEKLPAGHPLRKMATINFQQRKAVKACQAAKQRKGN